MTHPEDRSGWPVAIARGFCPRCRRGRVFRGLMMMNEACPLCAHRFEREPGFFVGAMYVSYGFAVVLYLALVVAAGRIRPACTETSIFMTAFLIFLPFVPFVFRYSRLVWLHLDWALDPAQ